jgi:hypothetical protein
MSGQVELSGRNPFDRADALFLLESLHPVHHQKGIRVGKALQELFPLFSFEQRFRFFGVNLFPPECNDESGNIIPYSAGGTNAIFDDPRRPGFGSSLQGRFSRTGRGAEGEG